MLKARGDRGCCDRCAGATGTINAALVARRRLLKNAVFGSPSGSATPGLGPDPAVGLSRHGGEESGLDSAARRAGAPDAARLPRTATGAVLDVSPHVLVIGDSADGPSGEQRFTLTADATTWRGAHSEATALRQGDRAVVRLHPSQRGVVDRIWANIGRVTGTIIEHTTDFMVVDEGVTRPRQIVVVPPRAAGRIQVRFPTLQPGYLIDIIGIRGGDALEGLIPATSQPAYPAGRLPVPPLVSGHVPDAISGSATWHEPAAGEPQGMLGVCYPALDPETGCAEDKAAEPARGYSRMPYLAIGSGLFIRNDCNGSSCVLPVTGCAAVARMFNDRCVTCGTSPRGRVADLTEASFVALGGELDKGCFNATITIGR